MSECIFCKMANHELKVPFLYEDDNFFAINDIKPQAPSHFLIITKEHIPSVLDIDTDKESIFGKVFTIANKLAREYSLADKGFRLVNNCLKEGGQEVLHMHFHVLGGRQMLWPPG